MNKKYHFEKNKMKLISYSINKQKEIDLIFYKKLLK